jgi:hypothetical protein
MTVSIAECSRCLGKFNFEWSWGASASSIKFGDRSIFRCPICSELNSFSLANKGRDPALPTYNDMQVGIGGRLWGVLLGPFFVLLAMGLMLLSTTASSPYYLLSLVPIAGGIAWVAGYFGYLYRRLGR